MSFDFDGFDDDLSNPLEIERIDTQETERDRKIRVPPIRIDHEACDDSGACVLICPEDVIELVDYASSVVKPEACTECWLCVENCTSTAIEIT